jgi:hypothetical protein
MMMAMPSASTRTIVSSRLVSRRDHARESDQVLVLKEKERLRGREGRETESARASARKHLTVRESFRGARRSEVVACADGAPRAGPFAWWLGAGCSQIARHWRQHLALVLRGIEGFVSRVREGERKREKERGERRESARAFARAFSQ